MSLRPNLAILVGAGAVIVLLSALMLPWQVAVASAVLGGLMIAGADVDARTFLLPDFITWGAVISGVVAAAKVRSASITGLLAAEPPTRRPTNSAWSAANIVVPLAATI